MKVYRLHKGKFLVPHSSGGRRSGFLQAQSRITNGKGLMLAQNSTTGGYGLSQQKPEVGYVSPPLITTSFQNKLQSLPVKSGFGLQKKKKLISF